MAWEKLREKKKTQEKGLFIPHLCSPPLRAKAAAAGNLSDRQESHRSSCDRRIIAWAQSLDLGQGNQELHK